ncbi:hypothetical protein ACJMK2_008044 [Sinanodonta woodiana]|uniref:Uncharacterized protein n=1 Tax=Sinanodonta woodiana TaxID=1069815 RepID=A0ABD3VJG3_SINWO
MRRDQHLGKATKNCSIEHDQTLCMIQVVKSRGEVSSFIRDCTDGVTFGFEEIKRLHNLLPTNQTTCATYGTSGLVVCMSVCKNDYCNGPQLANNGVDVCLRHYVFLIIFMVCAIVKYNKM